MFPVMRTVAESGGGGCGGCGGPLLDAAAVRQQRRLKQAIQFLHKDSADLLPLDGLKKLGTSTQPQPHHILQKRLLEATLARGRRSVRGVSPGGGGGGVLLSRNRFTSRHQDREDEDEDEEDDDGDEEEEEEKDLIYVPAKCLGREVKVLIDTGCKLNLMSSLTVDRFGLRKLMEEDKAEAEEGFSFQRKPDMEGHIEGLSLTFGHLRVMCSFAVVEANKPLVSLGTKTLKSLKSVIDTERQMLVLGRTTREQIHFAKKLQSERCL